MKHLYELATEEQHYAEKHHTLVYRFLSHYNLSEDDYYDIVIFGFLAAVQEYLRKPELQKFSFTTIAWKQMKNTVVQETRYRHRAKRNASTVSYFDSKASDELNTLFPSRTDTLIDQIHDREVLTNLLACLTPKEREVVALKADGYTQQEIADLCNISVYAVRSRFSRFRKRLMSVRHPTDKEVCAS